MIKAILIAMMTSGYVALTPSIPTYKDMAACEASIGKHPEQVRASVAAWNRSMGSRYLGKITKEPAVQCMSAGQYRQANALAAQHNAPIIVKAREQMYQDRLQQQRDIQPTPEEQKQLRQMRQNGLEFADTL